MLRSHTNLTITSVSSHRLLCQVSYVIILSLPVLIMGTEKERTRNNREEW